MKYPEYVKKRTKKLTKKLLLQSLIFFNIKIKIHGNNHGNRNFKTILLHSPNDNNYTGLFKKCSIRK